ncbi:hypothetical protein [Nocardioides sp.]|uniref:hypothetical protein n=1 Tax=Nocardioides sp. TaxID=35761 RepID=UPI00351423C0
MSSEAFAAAAAYPPAVQLIGPILSQYPRYEQQLAPLVTPLIAASAQGGTTLCDLLSPPCAPYRTQVLEAEAALAAGIAPLTQQLVNTPVGGCVIELQNALLASAG